MKHQIVLCDTNRNMVDAWLKYHDDLDLHVRHGSLFDIPCPSALVAPGNSFGGMNGGLDLAIVQRLGPKIEEGVQSLISYLYHGELPVGCAVVLKTEPGCSPQLLIYAPTMRTPIILPNDSLAPYLATRAALTSIRDNNHVGTIIIPGMGTGVGRIDPDIAAKQMIRAIREFWFCDVKPPQSWEEAEVQQKWLCGK